MCSLCTYVTEETKAPLHIGTVKSRASCEYGWWRHRRHQDRLWFLVVGHEGALKDYRSLWKRMTRRNSRCFMRGLPRGLPGGFLQLCRFFFICVRNVMFSLSSSFLLPSSWPDLIPVDELCIAASPLLTRILFTRVLYSHSFGCKWLEALTKYIIARV